MSDKDESMEQSFNDAELQDIMNEIESLEKEFVEEEGTQAEQSETVEAQTEEPVAEQETETETVSETAEEPQAEEQQEEVQAQEDSQQDDEDEDLSAEAETYEADTQEEPSNVVSMSTAKTEAPAASGSDGYMQFSGQGDMDMQLNFQLGQETATVNIKGGCLNVTLAGVQLELSENGCEVQMEGGVKFSVPLTGNSAQGKKAA